MEQAKPQLEGTVSAFGSASDPNCEGITLQQLADIDWDQIDLTEWLAMLATTDNLPSVEDYDLSMDGLVLII